MRAYGNQVIIRWMQERLSPIERGIRQCKPNGQLNVVAYGEVLSVGPGDVLHPDLPDVQSGNTVLFDLGARNIDIVEHGRSILCVPFLGLLARMDHDSPVPLFDQVLIERDDEGTRRAISSLVAVPDNVYTDGIQETPGSTVRGAYGRVRAHGKGIIFKKQGLYEPQCKVGDLVVFNPFNATDWRHAGKNYRFVPWEYIHAAVDE